MFVTSSRNHVVATWSDSNSFSVSMSLEGIATYNLSVNFVEFRGRVRERRREGRRERERDWIVIIGNARKGTCLSQESITISWRSAIDIYLSLIHI